MQERKSCFEGRINPHCFHTLSLDEWNEISHGQNLIIFEKGEYLCRQGMDTSQVIFILSGMAKLFLQSDTNRAMNISIVQSGEFIGLPLIFGPRKFNASAIALTEVEACMIQADLLQSLAERNNAFALRLIKRHLENENEIMHVISRLHYKQMPGKLALSLLYLSSGKLENQSVFPLLSRQDLADFAGISSINVVKLLKQFEEEGLIALDKKNIRILNREAIANIGLKG